MRNCFPIDSKKQVLIGLRRRLCLISFPCERGRDERTAGRMDGEKVKGEER